MTRLLVDENYPRSAVQGLAAAGHDVEAVADVAPGIDDVSVLGLARDATRCLVTFDSDFGELVFHHGVAPPPAILYLRLNPILPAEVLTLTLAALEEPLAGLFLVITRDGLRRRPFAKALTGDGHA